MNRVMKDFVAAADELRDGWLNDGHELKEPSSSYFHAAKIKYDAARRALRAGEEIAEPLSDHTGRSRAVTDWTLIPAAGQSQRFKDAGFETPKPFLRVKYGGETTTMLERAARGVAIKSRVCIGVPENLGRSSIDTVDMMNRGVVHDGTTVQETECHADTVRLMLRAFKILDSDRVAVADCDAILDQPDAHEVWDYLAVARVAVAVRRCVTTGLSTTDDRPWCSRFYPPGHVVSPNALLAVIGLRCFARAGDLRWALGRPGVRSMDDAVNALPPPYAAVLTERPWLDWGTPAALTASGAEIVT